MSGDFNLAWEALQPLIMFGVTVGVSLAVIVGFARLGWKYAPYLIAAAILVWFFS